MTTWHALKCVQSNGRGSFKEYTVNDRPNVRLIYDRETTPDFPWSFAKVEDGRMISGMVNAYRIQNDAMMALYDGSWDKIEEPVSNPTPYGPEINSLTPNDRTQLIEAVTNLATGRKGKASFIWSQFDAWGYAYESSKAQMDAAIEAALQLWRKAGCSFQGWINLFN